VGLFKETKGKSTEASGEAIKKEFLADMSYKIRNPLNTICGMSEILTKNLKEGTDISQLLSYMEILNDAARELQQVVDDSFYELEKSPVRPSVQEDLDDKDYSVLYNLRVLVVEDSSVSQMIIKELLEAYGSIITFVNDGKEAVDSFSQSIPGTYDAIFMDIKMPVMDGYEATDRIRHANHPQAKDIPIIALTAEAFSDDIQMALKVGMNDHVAKPISLDKIVSAVKRLK